MKVFRQKVNLSLESSTSIGVKGAKREDLLIKHHIPRDIDSPFGGIKTLEAFMMVTITKENTLFGSKRKLACIERAQIGPHGTPKNSEQRIIWCLFEKTLIRCLIINNSRRNTVDEVHSRGKGFIPKFKRNRSMSKEGKPDFNYMAMLSFCCTVLLVSMRA